MDSAPFAKKMLLPIKGNTKKTKSTFSLLNAFLELLLIPLVKYNNSKKYSNTDGKFFVHTRTYYMENT